jgi:hypothetical protein
MPFALAQTETIETTLQFALLLRDGFADSGVLLGEVSVVSGTIEGERKYPSGAFVFSGLHTGAQTLKVSSSDATPYYMAKDVTVQIPPAAPLWPAFPDITVADPNLPLGDPGQTAVFKAQRQAATLLPAAAYPFPEGTTLIRGTVRHGGQLLPDATVVLVGSNDPAYITADDGQFVLFWKDAPGSAKAVTIKASHAGLADANVNVTVVRGQTVATRIDM